MSATPSTHPSNILKHCPSCGGKNFLFNGEKSFTCGNCSFNYYINPAPAVAVIIEAPDGRIIVTRRKHDPRAGYLDLPGGFVDMMESAEDAAKREVMEELGIAVKDLRYIGSSPNEYVYKGLSYFTCDLGFVCRSDEISRMVPADDVSEAFLIRPEDIVQSEIGFPSMQRLLDIYIKMKA